ncbi:MAG: peroxiredoxin [Steroidobacteraceae bacterium]
MLSPGERAPEFTLPDHEGRDTSLTSLLRRGALVLYFYPADFTPGCTREACAIRDLHADIQKVGLTVAGVSPQDPDSHRRFRERHKLPFTLLSDTDKSVIRMYGVNGPLGFGVRRATFLIDPSRHIRDAVLADFRVGAHDAFVSRAIALNGD